MILKFKTYEEAWQLNERVTADCIKNNQWSDGTNNYCNPTQNSNGQWEVPILEGYEKYFTLAEISRAINPDWYSVPTWRIRAILSVDGMEQDVTNALATLPEPDKTYAERAWNNGSTTERNSPTINLIKTILSLTDVEVDDIFQRALNINI
jgi:hypothetical protein